MRLSDRLAFSQPRTGLARTRQPPPWARPPAQEPEPQPALGAWSCRRLLGRCRGPLRSGWPTRQVGVGRDRDLPGASPAVHGGLARPARSALLADVRPEGPQRWATSRGREKTAATTGAPGGCGPGSVGAAAEPRRPCGSSPGLGWPGACRSDPTPVLSHEDQLQVEGSHDVPRRSSSCCRIDQIDSAACWSGTATASTRRPASGGRSPARWGAPGRSTTTPSPNGSGRLRPARS